MSMRPVWLPPILSMKENSYSADASSSTWSSGSAVTAVVEVRSVDPDLAANSGSMDDATSAVKRCPAYRAGYLAICCSSVQGYDHGLGEADVGAGGLRLLHVVHRPGDRPPGRIRDHEVVV